MHTARKWFWAPCLNNIPFSARAQCHGTVTKSGRGLIKFVSDSILLSFDTKLSYIWAFIEEIYFSKSVNPSFLKSFKVTVPACCEVLYIVCPRGWLPNILGPSQKYTNWSKDLHVKIIVSIQTKQ